MAKVLTFRQYAIETDSEWITVNQPSIAGTGNTELEKRVNNEIQEKIDAIVAEARQEAKPKPRGRHRAGQDPAQLMPGDFGHPL